MKKTLLLAALMSMSPGMVYAQGNAFDNELDAELETITATRAGPQSATAAPVGAAIAPQGSVGNGSQPIYILNQATPTSTAQIQQAQVQKQPQVDISAAPLNKSRAEAIRDARQQAEVETENKIVEKLEASRMEDEKRRADALFGNAIDQSTQNNINAQNVNLQQQQAVQAVQVVPAQVVQAPVVVAAPVKEEEVDNRDLIREEVRAAIESSKPVEDVVTEQRYVGGVLGIGEYPDVVNVRGNYSLGASFGTKFDNSYAVEGTFLFSNYNVDQLNGTQVNPCCSVVIPRTVDVQQYSGSLALKYMLFNGMVKPVFGGLVAYSYRTFAWSQDQGMGGYTGNNGGSANSHAVDVGVLAGADVDFNKKFSLGFDFRYMFNMMSRVNTDKSSSWLTGPQYGTPIEKLQYYTMSLVGRVNF